MRGIRPALRSRIAATIVRGRARGFTMIELMVVVTVIGMLMSMLFPAVQVAREGARTVICEGNLRNITQGIFAYVARDGERQMLPTGGWGTRWTGNPNLSGENQPGGWVYQILPYIEEGGLYNLGAGSSDMTLATPQRLAVVLPLFICPSRRVPGLYPLITSGRTPPSQSNFSFPDTDAVVTMVPRGDYAMNAGEQPLCFSPQGVSYMEDMGPLTLNDGLDPTWWTNLSNTTRYEIRPPTAPAFDPNLAINFEPSGVTFRRGNIIRNGQNQYNFDQLMGVNMSMIDGPKGDGRAYVYLVGEKSMDVLRYNTGFDEGDDDTLFSGYGNDNYRTAYGPPARDIQENPDKDPENLNFAKRCRFGSAHPYGVHFSFCDGRIKTISYFIHPVVHAKLANRADNLLPSLMPATSPNANGVTKGVFWPFRAPETRQWIPNPNDNEF